MPLGALVALVLPPPFVAVTRTRSVWPTSAPSRTSVALARRRHRGAVRAVGVAAQPLAGEREGPGPGPGAVRRRQRAAVDRRARDGWRPGRRGERLDLRRRRAQGRGRPAGVRRGDAHAQGGCRRPRRRGQRRPVAPGIAVSRYRPPRLSVSHRCARSSGGVPSQPPVVAASVAPSRRAADERRVDDLGQAWRDDRRRRADAGRPAAVRVRGHAHPERRADVGGARGVRGRRSGREVDAEVAGGVAAQPAVGEGQARRAVPAAARGRQRRTVPRGAGDRGVGGGARGDRRGHRCRCRR